MPQVETQRERSWLERHERLSLAGVLALTFATFVSTFTFGWVYDDPPQIPGNADLRWDRLGFLFTHHLWASTASMTEARFYRPLLALWFLMNKTLFGLNPHWFHLTTVLAHVAATALAFFIARKLLDHTGGALFAAAIFGLHPLQVESVSWISSVNDSLAAVFCFTSFLACRKARRTEQTAGLWWVLAGASFLLALLVKEVSVVLPLIILVDLWYDSRTVAARRDTTGAGVMAIAVYGLLEIAWLLLRRHVLGQVTMTHSFLGWGTTLRTAPKIVLFQLYRVVLPVGLSPQYDFRPAELGAIARSLSALFALLALAVCAVLAASKARELWVAYAWLVLPLLPSLNLRWMNENDFIHDRYMYMSLLGVALLAGAGFVRLSERWPRGRRIPVLCGGLVVGLAFASAIQSQYWANDVHLFSRGVEMAPNNEWAHLDYGAALSSRERYVEAVPHFVRSYELKANWRAANYAGFAFEKSGDLSQAEHWDLLALEMNPSLAEAWLALGQIRLEQRRPAEAVVFLQKALEIQPEADGYHFALGAAFEQLGQVSDALDAYRTELRLHPYQSGARKAIERLSTRVGPK